MKIKNLLLALIPISLVFILSGCAIKRGEVTIKQEAKETKVNTNSQLSVYIKEVKDNRTFEFNPIDPNIPSLSPDEINTNEVKTRAIARKRNAYGKGLGDILLKKGQTVSSLMKENIEIAFKELGYKVIKDEKNITTDTKIVNVDINKFWSWMTPGFWAITLSTEISTNLKINTINKEEINVFTKDYYSVGTESNYVKVIKTALKMHIEEVKTKIDKMP
ncbi:MAG: flagellar biosynthesis protein [Campylobacteraceae bacterium]|nr:flagellar biosynthesis protein [Campylobacteraceae bacterium]